MLVTELLNSGYSWALRNIVPGIKCRHLKDSVHPDVIRTVERWRRLAVDAVNSCLYGVRTVLRRNIFDHVSDI